MTRQPMTATDTPCPRRCARPPGAPCFGDVLRIAAIWLGLLYHAAVAADETAWSIPRHAEEVRALTQPEPVLEQLSARIAQATQSGDSRELALLRLAEGNACRVLSRVDCQRDAGRQAAEAAMAAGDPHLQVRGLVLEASGAIAMQDFAAAEPLLLRAERELAARPHPLLAADVFLTYSSISLLLGDLEHAQRYVERGLAELGPIAAPVVRARLLRNQARAQNQSKQWAAAQATLENALALIPAGDDPKLRTELHIELARLAHQRSDIPAQQDNAERALALATQLENAQIAGMAREMLALAAQARGDTAEADAAFALAAASFATMRLQRDERRVLRQWMQLRLARPTGFAANDVPLTRLMQLEQSLDAEDQAAAASNFESRLEYAKQAFEVGLLKQSVTAATQRQRFSQVLIALGGILFALLVAVLWLQRRYAARLTEALRKRERAERAARQTERSLRALTDSIPAAVAHIDADERYLQVNAYLAQMVGATPQALVGKQVREVRGEALYAQVKPQIEAVLRGETVHFPSSGTPFGSLAHYNSVFVPERALDGSVIGFYALTFDITALREAQDELEKLARIDSLTGIANRRHFEERLQSTLAHAKRTRRAIAVLALDVDRFKQVNDTHGHAVGDAVLREFVARVLSCVRQDDFFARVGGDEFMLLIEEPPTIAGEVIARKLLRVMDAPFCIDGLTLRVSMSIGAAFGDGDRSAATLLAMADEALYDAKNRGRATFSIRRAEPLA
jgi:diguanylate cyclase (GGDEF)-like protein/PAS domain S-box-containing protein